MEVSILGKNSIKIRGKHSGVMVDPGIEISKTTADAVLTLDFNEFSSTSKIVDFRVVINGPGEYEVGGIKISAASFLNKNVYSLNVDSIRILLGKTSVIEKSPESDYKMLILNTDSKIDSSVLASFEPRVVILYGENSKEVAKSLGKENISVCSRFLIAGDKLPQETEVVMLENK